MTTQGNRLKKIRKELRLRNAKIIYGDSINAISPQLLLSINPYYVNLIDDAQCLNGKTIYMANTPYNKESFDKMIDDKKLQDNEYILIDIWRKDQNL